jgi:hypothetical protein
MIGNNIWELKQFGSIKYNLATFRPVRSFIERAEYWSDEDILYEIASLRERTSDKTYVLSCLLPPASCPQLPVDSAKASLGQKC